MRSALHRALVPLAAGPLAGLAVGLLSGVKHPDLALRLAGLLVVPGALVGVGLVPLALLASPARRDRLRAALA
ncbi:MAG: hypothetical protein JWM10_2273, partial [Myxococcaceae bacterium]|nr:hypothetical protein [Myxococcaceae bacterium]